MVIEAIGLTTGMSAPALVRPTSIRALDPAVLEAPAAAALAAILREGTPRTTVRAFEHAYRYWSAWHLLRFDVPLPLPERPIAVATVLQFVADHIPRTEEDTALAVELPAVIDTELVRAGVKAKSGLLAHATVAHRLALLSAMHRKLGFPSPTADERVAELLTAAKRAAIDQGRGPQPKPALPEDVLDALLETCDDSPAGQRDRALLAVMFHSGGRRRSEMRWLEVDDCKRWDVGYVLTFRRVKAKDGPLMVPLVGDAVAALDAWIETLRGAGITSGPVFRDVRGQQRSWFGDTGLSGHAVARILDRRIARAAIAGRYTPHSLRSGFTTDRLDRGDSYAQVMAMTGHVDPRTMAKHYHRPADLLGNPAAQPSSTRDT